MLTKDLNAGYCCSHGLFCFSMISSEGPEALMAMGQAVAICQHHLYMAFSEAPTGRPRGGEMVKNREAQLGGSTQEANQKSPTVVRRVHYVLVALRSRIFDFNPGTSSSWSPKAHVLRKGTL